MAEVFFRGCEWHSSLSHIEPPAGAGTKHCSHRQGLLVEVFGHLWLWTTVRKHSQGLLLLWSPRYTAVRLGLFIGYPQLLRASPWDVVVSCENTSAPPVPRYEEGFTSQEASLRTVLTAFRLSPGQQRPLRTWEVHLNCSFLWFSIWKTNSGLPPEAKLSLFQGMAAGTQVLAKWIKEVWPALVGKCPHLSSSHSSLLLL